MVVEIDGSTPSATSSPIAGVETISAVFWTKLESIASIMESMGLTVDQAMEALKIPEAEQGEYRAFFTDEVSYKESDYTKERQLFCTTVNSDEFHEDAVAYGTENPL